MVVSLGIPLEIYHGLLGRCVLSSRVFAILKNSLIMTDKPKGEKATNIIHITCDTKDARLLSKHAQQFYRAAIPYLEKFIATAQRKTTRRISRRPRSKA